MAILIIASVLAATFLPNGEPLSWLFTIGIVLIIHFFYQKEYVYTYTLFDLVLLLFVIYGTINYVFLSEYDFLNHQFWVYMGYIGCFYFFLRMIQESTDRMKLANFIFNGTKIVCLLEAMIGYLQYLEILPSKNIYFNVIGTFTSPNTLAAFLSIGIVLSCFHLLLSPIGNKIRVALEITLILFLGGIVIMSGARASWVAIIVALAILSATSAKSIRLYKKQKTLIKTGLILSVLILSVIGTMSAYSLQKDSVNGRGFIAQLTVREIAKKPVFGHGLFTFTSNYNTAKSAYFTEAERPWEEMKIAGFAYSTFNDYLNITHDLGIVGFFMALVVLILLGTYFRKNPLTRISLAVVSMILVFALFSYPLKVPHVMTLGVFAAALLKVSGNRNKKGVHSHYFFRFWNVLSIVLGITILYVTSQKIIAQKKYEEYKNSAKRDITKDELIEMYKSIHDVGYSNFNLGADLFNRGFEEEGLKYMEKGFKEFPTPDFGEKLANYYKNIRNYKRAEELYIFNKGNEPFRYKPSVDLAQLMERCNRIKDQHQISKEILDLPVKIPSKKIDTYKKWAEEIVTTSQISKVSENKIKGSLSVEKVIYSSIFQKEMHYRIYLPAIRHISGDLPVMYIVDGQQYLEETEIIKQTDKFIETGKIQPLSLVFVDPRETVDKSINNRHQYLVCNYQYVQFFIDELIPECESRYPINNDRQGRTILGHSLGGLYAGYLGFRKPEYFRNIAMQSPYFETCPELYMDYENYPRKDLKMYLSYGTGKDTEEQDVPMIETLFKKGYNLKVRSVKKGDHNWKLWKEQIQEILKYFYGT